jgi:hypothetical protein
MDYHGILMAENESHPAAYRSAARRNSQRGRTLNWFIHDPIIAKREGVPDDLVQAVRPASTVRPVN